MIKRAITTELNKLLAEYPIITILGPRQSGKTTLVKHLNNFDYSNLEDPETRELAVNDPKAYLAQFKKSLIIDEIQRVPKLLSYLQVIVDEKKQNGQFILTGSHQLKLQEAITQSLAGRTAILNLLPLSLRELKNHDIVYDSFSDYCIKGFYPRIYDQEIRSNRMYANYYRTYVERDVRQLIQLKDLAVFEKFIKLTAGRIGQIFDYKSLANDVGVDAKTIKNWLSILEASFLVFKLTPYYENFGKRVIKSPKYYFTDVGLLCYLLGIENQKQLERDPLIGQIFENLVVIEALKVRYNLGLSSNLYFFRDSNGNEIDLIFQKDRNLIAIEIKSTSTFFDNQLKTLRKFRKISERCFESYLVYNGKDMQLSDEYSAINFKNTNKIFNG